MNEKIVIGVMILGLGILLAICMLEELSRENTITVTVTVKHEHINTYIPKEPRSEYGNLIYHLTGKPMI